MLDVTKAKNAERALRESEERFRRLIAANIVGVGISDGGGDWLEANDELLRIIGCGREELRDGRLRWIDMTPETYRTLEEERIAEARRRGACTPYEKEYVRKDGCCPVLIGFAALEEGRDRFICFVLDLTLQKRVEAALKEADRRKDEFLAMLAHELRNPLAPIRNAVHVMRCLGTAEPICTGHGDDRTPGGAPGPPGRRPAGRVADHPGARSSSRRKRWNWRRSSPGRRDQPAAHGGPPP